MELMQSHMINKIGVTIQACMLTHPDSFRRLRRSHITAEATASRSVDKGTLRVLCIYYIHSNSVILLIVTISYYILKVPLKVRAQTCRSLSVTAQFDSNVAGMEKCCNTIFCNWLLYVMHVFTNKLWFGFQISKRITGMSFAQIFSRNYLIEG